MDTTTEGAGQANFKRRALAALALVVFMVPVGCDSEPEIDPEQERNIRPGQRQEGSPRDEEN